MHYAGIGASLAAIDDLFADARLDVVPADPRVRHLDYGEGQHRCEVQVRAARRRRLGGGQGRCAKTPDAYDATTAPTPRLTRVSSPEPGFQATRCHG